METRQKRDGTVNVRETVKFSAEQKRAILLYHFRSGLKPQQAFEEMKKNIGDDAPGTTMVFKWFQRFEVGHFEVTDDPRSGRPRTSTDDGMVAAVAKFLEEPSATTKRLADVFQVSKTSISSILHDQLDYSKKSARWVPRLLKPEEKEASVNFCKKFLEDFEDGNSPNFRKIITVDNLFERQLRFQTAPKMNGMEGDRMGWKEIACYSLWSILSYALATVFIQEFIHDPHQHVPESEHGESGKDISTPNVSTSFWCYGDTQDNRQCTFKNLCFNPRRKFIAFLGRESTFLGLGSSQTLEMDLGSFSGHNVFHFGYSTLRTERWGSIRKEFRDVEWIETPVKIAARLLPVNLQHSFHDDIIPLYFTLESICAGDVDAFRRTFGFVFIDDQPPVTTGDFHPFLSNQEAGFGIFMRGDCLYCFKSGHIGLEKWVGWYDVGLKRRHPQAPISTTRLNAGHLRRFSSYLMDRMCATKYPSVCDGCGRHPQWDILFLARRGNRIILNEAQVLERLVLVFEQTFIVNASWTSMSLEENSLHEIICAVSRAKVVLGVHGALLAMTVFMKPGSGLIELFPYALNPDNYTPYKTLAGLPGRRVSYRAWSNQNPEHTVTHPGREPSRGGIVHLSEEEQEEVRNSTLVPPALCCMDPKFLYRIYQDTHVDLESIEVTLRSLLSEMTWNRSEIDRSGREDAATNLPLLPAEVRDLKWSRQGDDVVLTWSPPWNLGYLGLFWDGEVKIKYLVTVLQGNLELRSEANDTDIRLESTTTVISLADLFGKSEDEEQEDHSDLYEIQEVLQNLIQSTHVLFTVSCLFPLLLMQSGFGFLEAGAVRIKNATTVLIKNVLNTGTGVLSYWLLGHGFALGSGSPFFGLSGFAFVSAAKSQRLFHIGVAVTCSSIVSAALAERTKFTSLFFYTPLLSGKTHRRERVVEEGKSCDGFFLCRFHLPHREPLGVASRGLVVSHGASRFRGERMSPLYGRSRRIGRDFDHRAAAGKIPSPDRQSPTHPRSFFARKFVFYLPRFLVFLVSFTREVKIKILQLAALGGAILTMGLMFLNGGLQVKPEQASNAILNSLLAASSGSLTASIVLRSGVLSRLVPVCSWSFIVSLNGALTATVSVAGACESMPSWAAVTVGTVSGILYVMLHFLILRLKVDDPLDVVAVHLGGGFWGLIASGLFSSKGLFTSGQPDVSPSIHLSSLSPFVTDRPALGGLLFFVLHHFQLLRIDPAVETKGLDRVERSEPAYQKDTMPGLKRKISSCTSIRSLSPVTTASTDLSSLANETSGDTNAGNHFESLRIRPRVLPHVNFILSEANQEAHS
ncbi:unnamed protein product [Darwinula stevensoni]|uniref:Uncharacterized protein n=1 Tax=Darwinula stevensoni TaxID=69355 RepID=A0A7R8X787_9CRUS|nr:unnamed protein product [Darwinula stevensoni]CAG0888850.1 unnamed protein product [Darwinula stevensoni]